MNSANTGYGRLLQEEDLRKIYSIMSTHRIDTFVRTLEEKKGKNVGKILPFVRGLRFSSLLIYTIRKLLKGSHLTANWGHLIDSNGLYCSRECDIIIHRPDGEWQRWNGDGAEDGHVMDFRFIEQDAAKAVISCKSFLRKADIEVDYCSEMKKYVNEVWLFAECCQNGFSSRIQTAATDIGYNNFWHLYSWSKANGMTDPNNEHWNDFIQKVKALKTN